MVTDIDDSSLEKEYSTEHLRPFDITYSIKIDGQPKDVTLSVHFSNHCYTRSRKEGDSDEDVLFQEKKRHGIIDERVLCNERWEFSKSLPEIIQDLHGKGCFIGGSKEIFYRQELPAKGNIHAGWYICARLGASNTHQNLTLSIRSVHWRNNRPIDIRGGPKRFYALLAQFYSIESDKRDWM